MLDGVPRISFVQAAKSNCQTNNAQFAKMIWVGGPTEKTLRQQGLFILL